MKEILLSDIFGLPQEKLGTMNLLEVDKALVDDDYFAIPMELKKPHLNVFGTAHGGILFTLCDQAVGAYLTYKKRPSVGMEASIHFYLPAKEGDLLTAAVYERKAGKRVGVYAVELRNQDNKLIADTTVTAMFQYEPAKA